MTYRWNNVSIGGGGYVTGIFLHPLEQDLVYIRTDVSGFYRWNSVDKSWTPITDHFTRSQSEYYGGEGLALDPNNSNIVYIAAGKYTADWASSLGTIFKSTDKGATWTKLSLELKMGGNENKRWVGERLVINPFNSNVIFFGSRQNGLWKSSNAGATWAQVTSFPGILTNIGITTIAFDRQVAGLLYVNAYGDGLYKSTDIGVTWSKMVGGPTTINRIAIANNSTVYVTSTTSPGVNKYINGSWNNITPPSTWPPSYVGVTVNPFNPDDVIVATGEVDFLKIFRSTNGGTSWTEKQRTMNQTIPWWNDVAPGFMLRCPWTASIEFDPKVAGRVWLSDWFGVWRSDDINAQPIALTSYVKNYESLVVLALSTPPSGSPLLSGVADVDGFNHKNGLTVYPSEILGEATDSFYFQDTMSIAYCESNPTKMVRVGGNRDIHPPISTGATSADSGLTWTKFLSWNQTQMPVRVAVSATNPNLFVVIVGNGQPLRTTNNGASWGPVTGLTNGPNGPWYFGQPLTSDTVEGNTFYYCRYGKFYRSIDGGVTFTLANSTLPNVPYTEPIIKSLPGSEGEIWVSLDTHGLYRSTNKGSTFTKITGVDRSYLFAFGKPESGSTTPALYLYGQVSGMGEGIFTSLDKGQTWTSIGDPKNKVGDEPNLMEASRQQFGQVFIGTNGRGIYLGEQSKQLPSDRGLQGEYFNNMDFSDLKLTRTDAVVDFDWKASSPDASIAADSFSIRWSGQVLPKYSEIYTFYTTSDDGVRLWVNDQLLIDNWTNHGPTENSGTISLAAGQKYASKMEYYENGGGAVAKLSWSSTSQSKEIIPQAQLFPTAIAEVPGTGLKGEYFNNIDFTDSKLTRTDATVDFDWGAGTPDASIAADSFSIRWSGQVLPKYSETYTFYTTSDDGVRLWVNDQLLIDNWTNHGPTENSGTISLAAGQKYASKMEYYENGGGAVAKLSWSSTSQSKEIVPQTQLYS